MKIEDLAVFKQIEKLFEKHQQIVLFHHIRPDGDCLGCTFGLKHALKNQYPNKDIHAVGNSYDSFLWWKQDMVFTDKNHVFDFENGLAVICDVSNLERVEEKEIFSKFKNKLLIDHHKNEPDIQNPVLSWVDSSYVACCEQVAHLLHSLKWDIPVKAANFLYLGIYTDSNRFLYDKTTQRTLQLASWLWDKGAEKAQMHIKMQSSSAKELKIISEIMQNYKTDKRVIYYYMPLSKQHELGIDHPLKASYPNVLSNVDDYLVWIHFSQQEENLIRVEFRSSLVSVRDIAIKFGGGGHVLAAGCMIQSEKQIQEIIDYSNKMIEQYLKANPV